MKRFGKIQLVIWAAALSLISCGGGEQKADGQTTQEENKVKVKLALVKTEPVDQIENFTATVEADVKNNIAPSMPVRIEEIFVEVGDHVKKGQKLVQMDMANLKQSKTQLDNLQVELIVWMNFTK